MKQQEISRDRLDLSAKRESLSEARMQLEETGGGPVKA